MTGEGLTEFLAGNGIVGSSAIATKPELEAVVFVETFSRSLRVGFVQKLAWSKIGWSFDDADEDIDEYSPVRS